MDSSPTGPTPRVNHLAAFECFLNQIRYFSRLFSLVGSEVVADVNVAMQKFNIKLFVPLHDGLTEMWIRQETVIFLYPKVSYEKPLIVCREHEL